MSSFHLQVVTPDGQAFEGQAQRVFCRTITGDVCILPRHCDYMTALGMGEARITDEAGQVRLVATTWEWAEDIDKARAESARKRAEESLAKATEKTARAMAEARLRRALVRLRVAEK